MCVGLSDGLVQGSRGTIHSPVCWHFRPVIITFPSYVTLTLALLNITLHPTLHSVTTDRSKCEDNSGMMCPRRDFCGSIGISSVHICVDLTHFPYGNVTLMPSVVGSFVATVALVIMKLLVSPESRIAHLRVFSFISVTTASRALVEAESPYAKHWSW